MLERHLRSGKDEGNWSGRIICLRDSESYVEYLSHVCCFVRRFREYSTKPPRCCTWRLRVVFGLPCERQLGARSFAQRVDLRVLGNG